MIIPNDASHLRFFAYLVGRPMIEGASILRFKISFFAFDSTLTQKRIYIYIMLSSIEEHFSKAYFN
ncbi:hypothetical protein SAMN06265367_10238 [Algoriphagus winogradskyi]|uniref:Uncharacterized protein n=1 Tax=Algoriphagus winogradskyi TaxID=237017 RepID=A0ABY1NL52_9BACT|nr:hypothetical protein SAMN06265367_10238 [Algoriphagus winogradskyi]